MTPDNKPSAGPSASGPSSQGQWHLGQLPPAISLFAIAAITGMATGLTAFLLKKVIGGLCVFVQGHFHAGGINLGLLVIPLVGILLAVAFQRYVARRNLQHGVDQMQARLKASRLRIPEVYAWGPFIASTLTLGFGGSAGAEGPIATSGSAIGSILARKFGLPPQLVRVMIGCGAGAGIAGIFKAPVGGFMFAIEVMGMEFASVPLIALIIACLLSGMTCYGLSGFTLDVPLTQVQHFHPEMAGWVIVMGVFCGLYSLYYRWVAGRLRALFAYIGRPWATALCSGAILSVLVFVFPALYGEGYDTMARVIDGHFSALSDFSFFSFSGNLSSALVVGVCGAIALVKPAACIATNSGGGVAGDFAPTLFAGCMAGMFFAGVASLIPDVNIYAPNFALSAMAAVMAGVVKAPLMAVFIVIEMTGYFGMMFPVTLAVGASYGTVILVEHLMRSRANAK